MKHFKLIGEKTTREFDIEYDEMITWNVIKIADHESQLKAEEEVMNEIISKQRPMQNEKIYPTKEDDLK